VTAAVTAEVRVEAFLGKRVRDADGRFIGHLHDVRARREGKTLVVVDYLVGPAALFERFSLLEFAREMLALFGFARSPGYVVPWQRMDLTLPGKPRCTCPAGELERLGR
jgi:sporulation protein YlmC with PRC-barrel domain